MNRRSPLDGMSNILSQAKTVREPVRTRGRRNPTKKRVSCTFNVPPSGFRKLEEMKMEHNKSLQAIMEEAIDLWLQSKGEPGIRWDE